MLPYRKNQIVSSVSCFQVLIVVSKVFQGIRLSSAQRLILARMLLEKIFIRDSKSMSVLCSMIE